MSSDDELGFPRGTSDERELFLRWLQFFRGAVIRNLDSLSDEQSATPMPPASCSTAPPENDPVPDHRPTPS